MTSEQQAERIRRYYEEKSRTRPRKGGSWTGLSHEEVVERVLNEFDEPGVPGAQRDYMRAAAGVLRDLAAIGLPVLAVQDLYQLRLNFGPPIGSKPIDYRAAVPVLLDWITKVDYPPLAHDILHAVSPGFAKKQARPVLLRLFTRPPAGSPFTLDNLRASLGISLGDFADPSVADEYIALALDRGHGEARSGIVQKLPKTKDERVPEVLLSLMDDSAVAPFAIQALGRIKYAPAKPHLERALDSEDWNVRTQAKKALKRLD
ncbi:HEAT repeat domain-containing protein [Kibdelosporangium persicum]|uniref:HEAT repeat domain-containing protein n=1 Tax=Kibdelosporangium persicum TaxID=2698649 RepID=UPI00156402B3|nr:HEAT repeat domain-containing protein [Kibdelosporangium persicum]